MRALMIDVYPSWDCSESCSPGHRRRTTERMIPSTENSIVACSFRGGESRTGRKGSGICDQQLGHTAPTTHVRKHEGPPKGDPSSVGVTGFEPATTCTPCKCATGLRYTPKEGANVAEQGIQQGRRPSDRPPKHPTGPTGPTSWTAERRPRHGSPHWIGSHPRWSPWPCRHWRPRPSTCRLSC